MGEPTTVNINGDEIELEFTLGALRRFEKRAKKPAFATETWDSLSADDILTLVWAAIPADKRPKDPTELEDALDLAAANAVMNAFARALSGNSPAGT